MTLPRGPFLWGLKVFHQIHFYGILRSFTIKSVFTGLSFTRSTFMGLQGPSAQDLLLWDFEVLHHNIQFSGTSGSSSTRAISMGPPNLSKDPFLWDFEALHKIHFCGTLRSSTTRFIFMGPPGPLQDPLLWDFEVRHQIHFYRILKYFTPFLRTFPSPCTTPVPLGPHHFHEEHADVEVGVLLDVLDDAGLDALPPALHQQAGRGHTGQLEALEVPQPPGQDLWDKGTPNPDPKLCFQLSMELLSSGGEAGGSTM